MGDPTTITGLGLRTQNLDLNFFSTEFFLCIFFRRFLLTGLVSLVSFHCSLPIGLFSYAYFPIVFGEVSKSGYTCLLIDLFSEC